MSKATLPIKGIQMPKKTEKQRNNTKRFSRAKENQVTL
jgi:hypothetical protein